ncbi:MAG: NEW3 domain-containing protein [Nitrososphaerota archaeon]
MIRKKVSFITIIFTLLICLSSLLFSTSYSFDGVSKQTVTVTKKVYLHGIVEDIHGKKLDNVNVILYSSGATIASIFSSYGAYAFSVESGNYELEFRLRGYENKRISISIPSDTIDFIVPTVNLDDALYVSIPFNSINTYEGNILSIPVNCINKGFEKENYSIKIDAPKSWIIECYIESTKANTFTLNPGESKSFNIKIGIPYGFIEKSSSIILKIVGYRIYEKEIDFFIEKSNVPIIDSKYNLLTISPSEIKNIEFTLTNPNIEKSRFKILLDYPKDWIVKILNKEGLETNDIILEAGESIPLNLRIEVPFYAEKGNYSISINAISNNVDYIHVINVIVPEGKLKMLSTKLQYIESLSGEDKTLQIFLKNLFNERKTIEFSLESSNGWIAELKDSTGSAIKSITLDSGEEIQFSLTVNIPENIEEGEYPIILKANSGLYEEPLKINFKIFKGYPNTRINIETPFIDVYAGGSGSIAFSLENLGKAEDIVKFRIDGLPSGFSYMIYDEKNNVVSSILLKPNDIRKLTIKINIPLKIEPSIINASLFIKTSNMENNYPLSLNIVGKYEISYVTENFYTETFAGNIVDFILDIKNTGYSTLTNVAVEVVDMPSSFNVTINPSLISTLQPLETGRFIFSIDVSPETNAGDYYITIKIGSNQVESIYRLIHVAVKQRTETIYIGIIIIIIAFIVLFFLYRKYGRR